MRLLGGQLERMSADFQLVTFGHGKKRCTSRSQEYISFPGGSLLMTAGTFLNRYVDLATRLESIILMLEQARGSAIVVADRAVCRVLLA